MGGKKLKGDLKKQGAGVWTGFTWHAQHKINYSRQDVPSTERC